MALTRDHLENDLGIFVLRGFPVERYSKGDLRMIYWGVGLHMGVAVSQSSKGDVLGDVKNFGDKVSTATGRGYMSREHLGFHTDTSDVVALFVLRTARSGGRSLFCSSVAIRDKIANTWPWLHDVLTQPFYWSWKGQQAENEPPYYEQPIFSYEADRFSSRYIKTHILAAQEFPDVPRLTEDQRAAMTAIDLLANDPVYHFSMMFEPGDIQFLNNHITYWVRGLRGRGSSSAPAEDVALRPQQPSVEFLHVGHLPRPERRRRAWRVPVTRRRARFRDQGF